MADFRPFSPCWGDISFTEAPRTTARCYAGAIFLSRSPFGATARARGVAWPRCPRVAGPGQTTRRRTKPHASTPGPTGMEGAGGTGGPGCGAGGRRRGQAKLRAKLAARTARGRAAAHGHTKQPGPPTHHTAPGTPAEPQATTHGADSSRAAGPTGAQNTSGATRHVATTKPPSPTGAGRLRQSAREGQRRITTMSGSPRPLS